MENKKRMPATVLAQMEVFDYLKEKVGERKTRTEAYCDRRIRLFVFEAPGL